MARQSDGLFLVGWLPDRITYGQQQAGNGNGTERKFRAEITKAWRKAIPRYRKTSELAFLSLRRFDHFRDFVSSFGIQRDWPKFSFHSF